MACEHDAAEMDTAAHWDGLCPLCMKATIERMRVAAERVCWFDWSGNDPDAVAAIEQLRRAIQ